MAERKPHKQTTRADNDLKPKKKEVGQETEQMSIKRAKERKYKSSAATYFQAASESRRRYDWEWLTRDLYRRGYQFSRYNASNRTVVLSGNSQVKIAINLMWAQMRVIRNQVTSFRPKWEVLPRGKSEEYLNNAKYSQKLLDVLYDQLELRKMIKETVTQGLLFSVGGPWQIGYDPQADEGRGRVFCWLIDTFDFYIDPEATSIEDAEYCAKAVRTPLDKVANNPEFNFYSDPLNTGESRQAESEYKQFLIQALKFQSQYTKADKEGVILKEFWEKVRVNDANKDELVEELKANDQDAEELRMGEVLMRVIHYVDFREDPLKVQLLRRSDFPFVAYQADINPVEFYGESWAKHMIPMNRVLNALESSVFQYNYKYGKGRIVIDKNSGVRLISNEHGDIIEKNRGSEVTSLPLQPIPTSYQTQIENMRRYIEDIGGAHDISMGRIPSGVKSGVGIAELKQADSTNQGDLVDNLEDFLTRVAKKILKEIATNYDTPKVIRALGKRGKPEHFAVVGEKYGKDRKKKEVKIGMDTFDIATIGADNEINVKIGSWLAYTKTAQQQRLQELYEAGVIAKEDLLEHLEFNDVQNLIENVRNEKLLEEAAKSNEGEIGAGNISPIEIANQENIMMVQEGRTDVEPEPTDAHSVHLAIHQDYADNPIVAEHMAKHEAMMKAGPPPQPAQQPQQPMQPNGILTPGATNMAGGQSNAVATPTALPPGPGAMGPGSPEEAALMQSIAALGGAGGGA